MRFVVHLAFTAVSVVSIFGQVADTKRNPKLSNEFKGTPTKSSQLVPRSITALNTPITENFDTLAATGTSSNVPEGWAFLETGANANLLYTAGTGSSGTGDTYSLGASGSSERAFGGLRTGTLIPLIGANFTNATGSTIGSISITYIGEQWRLGTANRGPDRLDFQYSLDATSLGTGTWTNVSALNFSSPITTGTVGALDGNNPSNRTTITATFQVTVPNGASIWLRWVDFDAPGADDALAIDDFSLTAQGLFSGPASISGRVVTADGRGIANHIVTVSGGDLAEPISVRTNTFGFYRIDGLPSGRTYFLSVSTRKYTFSEPTRTVDLTSDLSGVDFVAMSL